MATDAPKMTLTQYVMLSVMAYRVEGYDVKQLEEDVKIAYQWLSDAVDDPRRLGIAQEVLNGNLFIGVADGQVFFRSSH